MNRQCNESGILGRVCSKTGSGEVFPAGFTGDRLPQRGGNRGRFDVSQGAIVCDPEICDVYFLLVGAGH